MEVWMLLAVAGSGYLARCWHQVRKAKSKRPHEEDEDQHHLHQHPDGRPLDPFPAHHRHIPVLPNSAKCKFCQAGRARLPKWRAPKAVSPEGELVSQPLGQKEGVEGDAGSGRLKNGISMQKTSPTHERARWACVLGRQNRRTVGDTTLAAAEESGCSSNVSRSESVSLGSSSQNEFACRCQEVDAETSYQDFSKRSLNCETRPLADAGSSFQPGERSSYLNSHLREASFVSEESLSGASRDKCPSESLDNVCCVEEQMINKDELIFRLKSDEELKFHYDVFSFPMQNGREMKTKGSSSKKSRAPNKSGGCRSSISRRKSFIAASKPILSLESCLSAQFIQQNESKGCMKMFHPFLPISDVSSNDKPAFHISPDRESTSGLFLKLKNQSSTDHHSVSFLDTDYITCLPALSGDCKENSYSNKKRNILEKLPNGASSLSKNDYSALKDIRVYESTSSTSRFGEPDHQQRFLACSQTDFTSEQQFQGFSLHSNEELLFKLGLGFGMLFVIVFNRMEGRRHVDLHQQMQGVVNQLDDEIDGIDMISANENRQTDLQARELSDSNVAMIYDDKPRHRNDMAVLEAELEAELERMEFNLSAQDSLNHQIRSSHLSEADLDTVIHGELTASNLPCDVEVGSDDGSTPSIHEEMQMLEYAVSPVDLERRLHEVLEARQEERIRELEADLGIICNILETKERELQWWKNQVSYDGNTSPGLLTNKDISGFDAEKLVDESAQMMEKSRMQRDMSHFSVMEDGFSEHHEENIAYMLQGWMDIKGECAHKVAVTVPTFSDISKDTESNSLSVSALAGDAKTDYSVFNMISYALDNSKMSGNPNRKRHEKQSDCFFSAKHSVKQASTSISQCEVDLNVTASPGCSYSSSKQLVPETSSYLPEDLDAESIKSPSDAAIEGQFLAQEVASYHLDLESGTISDIGNLLCITDDSACDTSSSSPYSVKCMDANILCCQLPDSYLSDMQNLEACPYDNNRCSFPVQRTCDSAQLNVVVANNQRARTFDEDTISLTRTVLQSSKCPIQCSSITSENISFESQTDHIVVEEGLSSILLEENDDNSDLEEQLGKLLIKQIVEKTRQGSPILQEVQTVLASLETNEDIF